MQDRVLHESPILMIRGIQLIHWAFDLLHTWHLGPLGAYIALVLWFILELEPWGKSPEFLDKEDQHRIGLMHLRGKLRASYMRRRKTEEDWTAKGSEVSAPSKHVLVST